MARNDSATEGLIACFTGSVVLYIVLVLAGSCGNLAGDIARFGRLLVAALSLRDSFGETCSSLLAPIEKCPFAVTLIPFSGDVCVPVCVSFGESED